MIKRKNEKTIFISTLLIIIFLASCDIPSQKGVIQEETAVIIPSTDKGVPEQLSYPAWLEGSWYDKNPEYILIHAEGGDITCPIANNQSLYVTAKSYKEYAKEFTETLSSNSYTLKLIVEKDEGQYFYREREYKFKRISDTQITLHEIHTEIGGTERKEINETITLTKI